MERQQDFVPSLYPLSLSQKNIWDIERACPDTSINNICTSLHIQGRVDLSALRRSVDLVLSSDASLRIRIALVDGIPMQYQAAFQPLSIPVYDFTQTEDDGITSWESAFSREVLPLTNAPLYRFAILHTGESGVRLVVKMHHLISDGWTQVLLCNRIGESYLALLSGQEPELGEIPGYEVHIKDEQEYINSSAYEKDRIYWQEALRAHGEPSSLKSARGAAVSYVGNRLTFPLPQDLNNDIYTYCMRRRIAPFSVFYLALAIYFKRIGGADRFTIGVPIFNRRNFTEKQTSGMFVSTLPFSSEISGDWTFNELSDRLNDEWFEMLRHQRFPFSHIQALAQHDANNSGRLFHIAFSYQNGQLQESRDAAVSFSGRWHYSGYQLEQLCIHLSNLENNRRYSVDYDYLTQLFSAQEIETLHSCLTNILREALTYPDRSIGKLSILAPAERERVLYTFNRSDRPIFDESLYSRFSAYVRHNGSRVALIRNGVRTTYEQLEESVRQVHAALAETCAAPDTLVAVLLPRTDMLFAAIMGILRAGGAFLLLSSNQPDARIREILSRSGASALISTDALGGRFADSIPVIDADRLPPATKASPASYRPDGLAYVVYTSGSTGAPKGVEICCRSLLNLSCAMESIYGKGAVLSVCNIGFDAFLLESVCALLNGRTILLPRDEELESPRAIGALIRNFGVGFLSMTPTRLAAFMKNDAFRNAISDLESIVCGGEAFPSDLLQRLRLGTTARIYNQYGPSETTVAVSLKQLNDAATITVGSPMANCKLYVLDNWGNPLPIGIYGNLYVGGVCVGRGYRNAEQLTAESFSESPFELGDRLYRTGDIARWTHDGEIILAGRSDHQIKLRGLRIEPQEVSDCLKRHPMVLEAAAVVQRHSGQDTLLAFYTACAPVNEQELLALCAAHLPYYMIPSAILRLDEIPMTGNGKVNEALLPHPDLTSGCGAQPTTLSDTLVLNIFRRVLNRTDISPESDYFLFGGNSLNAMEVLSEIARETGKQLRVSDLYVNRSARRLAALLEDGTSSEVCRLVTAPQQKLWPLTPIQQGLYFQTHLDPTGKTYHMAGAFRLNCRVDHSRLEGAFRRLIADDPILRTAFISTADGIFAYVEDEADFVLPIYEGATLEEAAQTILEPFDLAKAPLLRAGLWKESEGQWILLLNLHHIIGDGLTTPILLARLDAIYRGANAAAPSLSYLDYAWHLTNQQRDTDHLDYWTNHLSALPESLDLPADFARGHDFDFRGGKVVHTISSDLAEKCDAFCQSHGISPYVFFLAAFGLLMTRLSGKDDVLIGAAAAGRLLPETREMCGPFINTLPLRLHPQERRTTEDYLASVRDEVNAMLDHQQIGLEEIVSSLGIKRTLSQSPLYQVIFSQRPVDTKALSFGGEAMDYLPLSTNTARMDLWVELAKENGTYSFHMEYATQLFLPETAAYYGRCLETIAASLLRHSDKSLAHVDALSAKDRIELVDIPNNTTYPFLNLPVPTQFARNLMLDPDAPAVIFHGETTTRAQLDRRACQIANLLAERGAGHGTHVGITLSRNADLVAAVLAIWKVGGAYVPLLAHYPEQRLLSMAETAGITHILVDAKTAAQLPDSLSHMAVPLSDNAKDTFDAFPLAETDLAEILFTSGSTGNPKGVMLRWRSVANMVQGYRGILERSEGPILCTTNVVFDMFNGEVTIPLAIGKTIVMADEEEMMLPWKLGEIIARDGVKITQSTPSRVQMWLSNESFCRDCAQLEVMIYGGEVLTEPLLRAAQTAAPNAVQTNMYGPTEGTVYNTTRTADYRGHINVGWPMQNSRIYVLDEMLRPVLPTAAGDLYLSGECVSEGYINRPDLTEAAYLPDPFYPGQRMYRTGDVGRLRLDGSYDFLGRRDAQVKLNGQRVELDEINGAFVSQGCAIQAATVPVRHDDGSMELVTYFVPTFEQMEEKEIRNRIERILPAYMVPSSMVTMSTLPSTPTGKIDLRTLKEMAAAGISSNAAAIHSEAAQEIESAEAFSTPEKTADIDAAVGTLDWVLALWRKVLGRSSISPDVSFFEQGGTSLAALNILSFYNNSSLTLTLAKFYENPTARAQAEIFAGGAPAAVTVVCTAEPTQDAAFTPTKTEGVSVVRPSGVPSLPGGRGKRSLKTILLTGATGFLGVHILKALLDEGAQKIICTMRDGSRERLIDTLGWYFGAGWVSGIEHQIDVLHADISRPGLGLSPKEYQSLSGKLTAIWNCAADVRHYAADADALLATNLSGTEEIIKLARASGAPLYHMSTTSVSGTSLVGRSDTTLFTEDDFDIGQNWQDNLYVRSKFLAEEAVFEAIRSGLTARVFRLGRLVGRSQDGIFQKNAATNAFYLTMRSIHALGAIPESMARVPMELTPIDWCAQAAVALRNSEGTVYHLQNPAPPTAEDAIRAVVPDLEILSDEAFVRRLISAGADKNGAILAPLVDFYHQFSTDKATIAVDNKKTMSQLEKTGFTDVIAPPQRLLRGFRFSAHERIGKEE